MTLILFMGTCLRGQFHRPLLLTVPAVGTELHQCAAEVGPVLTVGHGQLQQMSILEIQCQKHHPHLSKTPHQEQSYALHVLSQCGRGKRSPHIVIQRQNNKAACLAFECWIFIVSVLRKGKMGTMGRLGDDVGSLSAVRVRFRWERKAACRPCWDREGER